MLLDLMVVWIGSWGVWFAYNMSVTRGRHRVVREKVRGRHKGQWPGWRVMITGWEGQERHKTMTAQLGWGWNREMA